jgi:hypothetical protein
MQATSRAVGEMEKEWQSGDIVAGPFHTASSHGKNTVELIYGTE